MHNQITAATGMDQESPIAPDNTFGTENWVDMNSFQHQTTMPDYGGNFGFIPPINHGLPSESLNRMPPPPPPPQPLHQPQATHSPLPVLMMRGAAWPSMLTNPNTYGPAHSAPPIPIAPIAPVAPTTTPLKTTKLPSASASQPRKTLTDDDRRAMCQYAEDHPTAKQTDIGARFGVERSTVSKVLRNKDKYLNSEERSSSPVKRSGKGKQADIEKALVNFIRKGQRTGAVMTRELLMEKARLFTSLGTGDSLLDTAWLDKFMLKHGIGTGGGRLLRRASETNIPDSIRDSDSPSLAPSQPSSAISPASPTGHLSPSPLSANKSDEEKESMNSFMDFTADGVYKHSNSQSTTSLSSAFTDAAAPSFPGSAISPTASFNFSPDPNVGTFLAGDQSRQLSPHGAGFQRPRSQTFPTLDLEYLNQSQSAEPATPKYMVPSTAPSSALETTSSEHAGPAFGFEQAVSPPQLRHSSSNSSIAGRSTTTPVTSSAVGSSPGSPTQEDARKAADTLLSFITNASGFVDHNEYLTVVRLTEKLRIHQSQLAKAAAHGIGLLSRIPEGDSEMPSAPPTTLKVESTMSA
ncbi:d5cf318b-a9aa-4567-a917-fab667d7244f [Thermothielavioides terrestris]|uniref:HTH CENPB-type domain-containing protein n=2 Tax=Thermothielavioides terrestris TaxID=2587410 RepID=G2RBX1_THETT|nr:uncharacterized protein THITE_2119520 [Thermothielavioides terrestris NRRL 8126]AEO69292.1 hypothetical protein THITE_2119520 [Thermothielavioides terrestris NRRL 8126]SPQ22434.1 d5cf318b-a9aa-4567-a917-fab667d7244f [Thermothielavioides terrestris]